MQGQTVKALLSASLRVVRGTDHLFCRTQTCPIAYFSPNGEQTFALEHLRERVYQEEPDADDVWVCYCFRHTVGDVRAAPPADRAAILEDIGTGTRAGNARAICETRRVRVVWETRAG